MKRTLALLCAALLAFLCFACGQTAPKPLKSAALLTLYTQPLRVATQLKGVTVTLQKLEVEPTLRFLHPVADEWEETLTPGKEYEIDAALADGIPEYRLYVRQGKNMALCDLTSDLLDAGAAVEIAGKPWAPAPIDENSPMIHLCRMAAIAPGGELYDYWYAIASAVSTLRGVDLDLEGDEGCEGCYRVPGWLFDAYAQALFPGVAVPALKKGESDWVSYHPEDGGSYWVGPAWSTWLWAEYKSAKRNQDGTWDVTITVGTEDDEDGVGDSVIKLAPNEAYDPGSPFEYHLVGLPTEPDMYYGMPEGADWGEEVWDEDEESRGQPPPDFMVGTWRADNVKRGYVVWLEVFPNGKAGLYLGDDQSGQIYEIYNGWLGQASFGDDEGEASIKVEFGLGWHIYESDDGSPINIPGIYSGIYTFRQEGEALIVTAGAGADPLYGKKTLTMFWDPMTLDGSVMVEK